MPWAFMMSANIVQTYKVLIIYLMTLNKNDAQKEAPKRGLLRS
jgi:hypothetical protein